MPLYPEFNGMPRPNEVFSRKMDFSVILSIHLKWTVEEVESHLCVKVERGDPRNVSKVDRNFTKVINKDLFSGESIAVSCCCW